MDRRRLASLAAIAVAGFASLATTPPTPSPPPSVDESLSGTVDLSADNPVVIREIVVRVTGMDPTPSSARLASVIFTPTAAPIDQREGAGEIRVSVVRAEPVEHHVPTVPGTFHSLVDWQASPPALDLLCDEGICEGRFALIVDAVNRTAAEPVSVDWNLAAHVELWSGIPAGGQPAVAVTVDDTNRDAVALTSAEASGETPLDLTNRFAMWRLSLTLGDEALAEPPGWPIVVTARLRPTANVDKNLAGGPYGPNLFIEGAGDNHNVGIDPWRFDDTIEFEPFWSCVAGERCVADYVVGVDLDLYQDAAVDAGWAIDVRAIAADGRALPLTLVVKPVPPMPMISTTIGGTLVIGPDGDTPPIGYKLTERPARAGRDLQWDGLRLPTYGILRGRATSTGAVPLPTRGFEVRFGPPNFRFGLTLNQDGVFGFTPGGPRCRVPDCDLTQVFSGGVGSDTDDLRPDMEVTIEWELEVGMGTTVTNGDSKLSIEPVPLASPSP